MTIKPLPDTASRDSHPAGITLRRLGAGDAAAVKRLAQLDSRRPPNRSLLGAELEGRLLAAISLSSGETIADPFEPTAELVELLRIRAGQLARNGSKPGLGERLHRLAANRARAALAGSPPGAGGRLLVLSRRQPG